MKLKVPWHAKLSGYLYINLTFLVKKSPVYFFVLKNWIIRPIFRSFLVLFTTCYAPPLKKSWLQGIAAWRHIQKLAQSALTRESRCRAPYKVRTNALYTCVCYLSDRLNSCDCFAKVFKSFSLKALSHLDDLASVCRRLKICLKCWHTSNTLWVSLHTL